MLRLSTQLKNGNHLHFWVVPFGATILNITFGDWNDPTKLGDAGNTTGKFLNGTILNSEQNSGVIRISNPSFSSGDIILDMSDIEHPMRTSETGEVEQSGFHNEVWVDFNWHGENAGDFYRPFNTLSGAVAAVADHGVIKIMPGLTKEKPIFLKNKSYRIVAPVGGVALGIRE